MACRRIHVILHTTCSNLLMNMLSSCTIICISNLSKFALAILSAILQLQLTRVETSPGLPYIINQARRIIKQFYFQSKEDDPKLNDNLRFYKNEIPFKPRGMLLFGYFLDYVSCTEHVSLWLQIGLLNV